MKRELTAACLLAGLFIASLININWFENRIENITSSIEQSRWEKEEGDTEASAQSLRQGLDTWLSIEDYTHIFIRHPEIDSATDAFYELLENLYSEEAEETSSAYDKLLYHLNGLVQMEKLRLGSIF